MTKSFMILKSFSKLELNDMFGQAAEDRMHSNGA